MEVYRADQVGSLLRPPELLTAHAEQAAGRLSLAELRALEDKAIDAALAMQQATGIEVYSDGEYRRSAWQAEFAASVEGYVPGQPPIAIHWRRSDGQPPVLTPATVGGQVIGQRLRPRQRLTAPESSYLMAHAPGPFKITMPAPSYVVARGYKPGVTDQVYASRAEVLADAARIIGDEIKALVAEGVRYIQLDNPHYPDYIDAERREQWRAIGIDVETALREDVAADNACLQGFEREGVTLAMHICRGNGGQAGWHSSGGYEAVAEQVFGGIDVDRFLLEYDSDRAGGFEPLRWLPRGKVAVLGLVTTKAGALESQTELIKRIDEAAKVVPLADLALSPQCGFASVMAGNPLTPAEQQRKLELVAETAHKVWS